MPARPLAYRLLALLPLVAASAGAVDFVVTRYDDPGPNGCQVGDCSLREAVISASFNHLPELDRIFLSAGRYELSIEGANEEFAQSGDLDVFESVEILGAGATMTFVDANGLDRVFDVHSTNFNDVLIADLTVTGGANNTGAAGIGVGGSLSTLVLERVEVRQNTLGAGLFASTFAELTVRDSTVESNGDEGIFAHQATVTLENVTVTGNGGPELVADTAGDLGCTHCTIYDNGTGAEVSSEEAGTQIAFVNSIVAGSCAGVDGGTFATGGGNMEGPGDTCAFDPEDEIVGALIVGVGSLDDHGGPTRTRELFELSPAVGAASFAACLATDQRGAPRSTAAHSPCDSGAFELGPESPPTPIFRDGLEQGNDDAWSSAVV